MTSHPQWIFTPSRTGSWLIIGLLVLSLPGCKTFSFGGSDSGSTSRSAAAWSRAQTTDSQTHIDFRRCERQAEDDALAAAPSVRDEGFVVPGQGGAFAQTQYHYARRDKARYTVQCMQSLGYAPKAPVQPQ